MVRERRKEPELALSQCDCFFLCGGLDFNEVSEEEVHTASERVAFWGPSLFDVHT